MHVCARVPRAPPGRAGTVVMVALVIMQPEVQQSVLFFSLEVPQIQFKNRVPDIPVVCRDEYAQCKTVRNTVETSQVQGMVVGVPVNCSDSSSSSPSAWSNCAQDLGDSCGCGYVPCDHAAAVPAVRLVHERSASVSVHRQSVVCSCSTETGFHFANCAEDRRNPTGACAVLGVW